MKDINIWVKDTQNSLQSLKSNVDGALLVAIDDVDVTANNNITQLNSNTIAVNQGVANDGTLRIVHAVDVGLTTATAGDIAAATTDSGNPLKIGGVARTANPTAVTGGQRVNASFDDLGRQLITPYQVRDLIATAYVSLTNGTEAELLAAGAAGVFHDLIEVTFANTSTGAVTIDLRDATAGGIVKSFQVPGGNSITQAFTVPIPQNAAALPWTADMDDVSATTTNVSATFIKNV